MAEVAEVFAVDVARGPADVDLLPPAPATAIHLMASIALGAEIAEQLAGRLGGSSRVEDGRA